MAGRSWFGFLLGAGLGVTAWAQHGGVDPTFNTGTGPNALVNVIAVQPDGRILLGGSFGSVDGVSLGRIARLNPEGAVDVSFQPGAGANNDVRAIAVQPDGRIVVGGDFTVVDGASRRRVARLLPDGRVDHSFQVPGGADNVVHDLALQPDGRVVVVGEFTTFRGVPLNRIARLNADGSLNTSFDPGTGANGVIRAVALQADGKLVIGGDFTAYQGLARNRIARLNADGSLDGGFLPGTGMNNSVRDLVVDDSGRILAGGQFTQVAGTAQRYLARLTATGAVDPFFNMAVGFNNTVNALAIQPDGRILAAGTFTTVNQIGRVRVARLGSDGSVDLTFDPGSGPSTTVLAVAAPANGNVLMGGQFTTVAGQNRRYAARLSADGGSATSTAPQIVIAPVEQQVNAGLAASLTVVATGNPPVAYQWTVDGQPVPGGTNSTLTLPVVRPEQAGDYVVTVSNAADTVASGPVAFTVLPEAPAAGSLDLAFNSAQGPNGTVRALALQPDGRALIGGAFTTVDGQPRSRVARLLSNGSVDPSFAPLSGTSHEVTSLALLPDGRILIGGDFLTYNGAPRARIARILADSSLDTSFVPGLGANNTVDAVAGQSDGKVLIGGVFTTVGGETRNYLARLNADGSLDAGFNPPGGASGRVRTIVVVAGGKIMIGGDFTRFAGVDRNRIARLNTDGSVDDTFTVGTGFNNSVSALAAVNAGVLVGGSFANYAGAGAQRLALLDNSGGLSPLLDALVGYNNTIQALTTDADGHPVVAGAFTTANGLTRNRVARLLAVDGSVDTTFDPAGGANSTVHAVVAQPDGKIIIGGQFTSVGGTTRRYVARLNADPRPEPPAFRLAIRNTDDGVRVDVFAERGFDYSILRSYDLRQWHHWMTVSGAGMDSEVRLLDPTSKTQPHAAYRGVYP
ncbi:MAG: immunoglobulin domain-containing protein [Verrucomicrobiales bacterium]|nr:immunoglobulin domain-containing protein [Verrucomicrobiales bacterium]